MSPRKIFFFLIPVTFLACQENDRTLSIEGENIPSQFDIIDKGLKIFALDIETDFTGLINLQLTKIDGKEYLSFYNRKTHSIYLYDHKSGVILKKIKMDKQGPNNVKVFFSFQYFIHSMDSIFINSAYNGIYLINSQGEVLKKKLDATPPGSPGGLAIDFDLATYFANGLIHCKTRVSPLNRIEGRRDLRAVISMDNDSIIEKMIDEKTLINGYDKFRQIEREKGRRLVPMHKYFTRNSDFLYASTPISDSIYVIKESKLVDIIYTGDPLFDVADAQAFMDISEIEYFEGGVRKNTKAKQPPHYTYLMMDPDGKFVYRVLIHGTKPELNLETNEELPGILGATLVVINLETEKTKRFNLPIEDIQLDAPSMWSNVFVSEEGIHFRVKDQENENEIKFRIFGVR